MLANKIKDTETRRKKIVDLVATLENGQERDDNIQKIYAYDAELLLLKEERDHTNEEFARMNQDDARNQAEDLKR